MKENHVLYIDANGRAGIGALMTLDVGPLHSDASSSFIPAPTLTIEPCQEGLEGIQVGTRLWELPLDVKHHTSDILQFAEYPLSADNRLRLISYIIDCYHHDFTLKDKNPMMMYEMEIVLQMLTGEYGENPAIPIRLHYLKFTDEQILDMAFILND